MTPPSVGRVVHYVSYGTPGGEYHSRCRAAMIAEVGQWITVDPNDLIGELGIDGVRRRTVEQLWDPEACALSVFNPTGVFFNGAADVACRHVEPEPGPILGERSPLTPGTWHWPERL